MELKCACQVIFTHVSFIYVRNFRCSPVSEVRLSLSNLYKGDVALQQEIIDKQKLTELDYAGLA